MVSDLMGGPEGLLVSGVLGFGLLLVVTVIEALMLYQTKWERLQGCFRDAAVANGVSALLLLLLSPLLTQLFGPLLLIAAALILSILSEGFVLVLLRRRAAARCYLAALISNTASFVFVFVYALSFLMV